MSVEKLAPAVAAWPERDQLGTYMVTVTMVERYRVRAVSRDGAESLVMYHLIDQGGMGPLPAGVQLVDCPLLEASVVGGKQ